MKVLLLASDFMEDVEALATRALLMRAGLTVETLTFSDALELTTAFNLKIKADGYAKYANPHDYDCLVIPGGPYVGETIDRATTIQTLAKHFNKQEKIIAAICAGPRFLGRAGLLKNKRYTAFPGSEQDGQDGTYLPDEKVVIDGFIITARGAGCVYDFVHAIIKKLLGEHEADALLASIRA